MEGLLFFSSGMTVGFIFAVYLLEERHDRSCHNR